MDWLFKHNPSVFNIPLGLSFVDCLAKNILKEAPKTPFSLNDTTILLPNHRSVRALKEAFLRHVDGKVLLLPSIKAIGDIEGEDIGLDTGFSYNAINIPEAISPKHRRLILTNLILEAAPGLGFKNLLMPQALNLAEDLGNLIDEVETFEASWSDLPNLVDIDLAHHWKQTLTFLEIVTKFWPQYLKEIGLIDASTRRRLLLDNYREMLDATPPLGPVIAAGSTGTIPATARLLKTISRLPKGAIILPGVDLDLPQNVWDNLSGDENTPPFETHPQFALKTLLDTTLVGRDEIGTWPQTSENKTYLESHALRKNLLGNALMPANAMSHWQNFKVSLKEKAFREKTLNGISMHIADGLREEASAIALMMREVLETPSKRAALITTNTQLARRVEAELLRWDVSVDKSSGNPLLKTPPAAFMALVSEAVSDNFTPLAILSLLKHPFMTLGYERVEILKLTRKLEILALRGPRPGGGLKGLKATLKKGSSTKGLYDLIERLEATFTPFLNLFKSKNQNLKGLLHGHILISQNLTKGPSGDDPGKLWKKDEGITLSNILRELLEVGGTLKKVDPFDYPLIFKRLLESDVVRHSYRGHPRLAIWGTLEGRLQSTDLVILGDLNEGSWPPAPQEDPWMSRPMRAGFGLPSLERRVGQSAHDFCQALGANEVILSRSEKIDSTPTVPSRWILRLEALLDDLPAGKPWSQWQRTITEVDITKPWGPPEPRPPVSNRPLKLSVTNVGLWMKDPYALFAKHILKLRPLDPIDQEPGAAQKGNQFHEALEDYAKGSDKSLEALITAGEKAFKNHITRPGVWAFWWPRFIQVAENFVKLQESRFKTHNIIGIEAKGNIRLKCGEGEFKLFAEADRIDQSLEDQSLEIIDYKTGTIPKTKQIKAGFEPQLPLEGIIAQKGGFEGVEKRPVTKLEYWKISGGKEPIKISNPLKKSVAKEIEKAKDGLTKLVEDFSKLETPYLSNPDPEEKSYGEYNHLARVKEWLHNTPDIAKATKGGGYD